MESNSSDKNNLRERARKLSCVNFTDEDPVNRTFRVLPLFELDARKVKAIKKYSLLNNEHLAKEWRKRTENLSVKNPDKRVRNFPNIDDYHFKNCRTQFSPSLSHKNFPHPALYLKPGPGRDKYGERPIPVEFMMRRSQALKQNKASFENKTLDKARILKSKTDIAAEPGNVA